MKPVFLKCINPEGFLEENRYFLCFIRDQFDIRAIGNDGILDSYQEYNFE